MEFVFGNSGKGYGLLYQRDPKSLRDEQISEYAQKINDFNVDSGEGLYTYKVVSDGVSFTAIFSLYAHDNNFGRGAFYNHVKWHEYSRKDFLEADFLDGLGYTFASQDDMNALRETGELALTDKIELPSEATMLSKEALCSILHTLLTDGRKKIVITSDVFDADSQTVGCMRGYIKQIFLHLPVDLRATTSFVTGCDLDAFIASEYRLTVLSQESVKRRSSDKLAIISVSNTTFTPNDEWVKYIQWIVDFNQQDERDKFFTAFEGSIGKGEINALGNLLDFHKKYTSPKVEIPKQEPKLESKATENRTTMTTRPAPHRVVENKPQKVTPTQAQVQNEPSIVVPPPAALREKLESKDGKYFGETANNKPHGIGEMLWSLTNNRDHPYGYSYIGQWNNDKKHGYGAFVARDGRVGWRIGWWENDNKSTGFYLASSPDKTHYYPSAFGKAKVHAIENEWYIGTLDDHNIRNGWGATIIWTNPAQGSYDWYVGQWASGQRNGWGVYRYFTGEVISGKWVNGTLVEQY